VKNLQQPRRGKNKIQASIFINHTPLDWTLFPTDEYEKGKKKRKGEKQGRKSV
jgi:hypothetical protein